MPEDAWRQFAHDPGNTGYNPVATGPADRRRLGNAELAISLPELVEVKWQYTSPAGSIWLPTIADDTLYAGDLDMHDPETSPGTVHAVNLSDGTERWRANVADGATSATVVGDTVFVESWDTNVYALDAATGEERWRYDAPTAPPGEIHVYDGTVYIPSRDTTLYVVDASTGDERWRFEEITAGGPGIPAIANDTVYVATPGAQTAAGNSVYALDVATGAVRWQFDEPRQTTTPIAPDNTTEARSTVFVAEGPGEGSGEGVVYAINATTGEQRFRFDAPTSRTLGLAVADDTAYVGSIDGAVYAFSTKTGEERWQFEELSGPIAFVPTAVPETVYIAHSDGNLYALDGETGRLRWQFDEAPGGVLSPSLVGDTAYVASGNGTLYAVS
ncbi:outer membrane protein assembly factor BamB family protein [Halorussus salinisoli]|uniref:outer membrane protein assembly factor BamB family protein n=1 Tax=Halorussus salinisoli TaxID=2558242 RepID=UPI00148595A1|nr:PQQ-binding-like beta-propeller repeat protein [Halorussus salinisoli]